MPFDTLPLLEPTPELPAVRTRSKRVLRFRLKDKHAKVLLGHAKDVNLVWNYCNELGLKVFLRERRFMSGFDFQKYLNGASKEGLRIGSAVFQQVAEEFATRRRQHKKIKLSWRKSGGARRSLGWVPFKARAVTFRKGQIWFAGQPLSLWDSYGLAQYKNCLRAGNFSEDARGRWYLNVVVEVDVAQQPKASVEDVAAGRANDLGIDLGLKEFLASSDGQKIAAQQIYRGAEAKLAIAQRAGKKARVKTIHAQIGNRRKDFLQKLSTRLVCKHDAIFVGNVNAAALAKGMHSKSVLDAGWSAFRTMLRYKCDDAGVRFEEVDERYTTQACSECGALPPSRPKGIAGLGIREWKCDECGAVHDRDVNAARNILAAGRGRLAVGIAALQGGEDVNNTV